MTSEVRTKHWITSLLVGCAGSSRRPIGFGRRLRATPTVNGASTSVSAVALHPQAPRPEPVEIDPLVPVRERGPVTLKRSRAKRGEGDAPIGPRHGHVHGTSFEERELRAEVHVAQAPRERSRANRFVPRRVTAPAEGLAREREVADVRPRGDRRLVAPVALARAAGAGERLVHLVVELHREVQVRARAVPARGGPADLLSCNDALVVSHHDASAQVPVDGVHVAAEAGDDHVVVDLRHRALDVLVGEVVGDLDHDPVQCGEDRHADPLLAEGADDRVLSGVAVVGLAAAIPVEGPRPGVEVDEVGEVQVLPEDPGLRVEGEDGRLGRRGRARRGESATAEGGEEQSGDDDPCNALTILRALRRSKIEHLSTSSTTAPSRGRVRPRAGSAADSTISAHCSRA